jgi:hypothetical protein
MKTKTFKIFGYGFLHSNKDVPHSLCFDKYTIAVTSEL